jgi:hypothetical protein
VRVEIGFQQSERRPAPLRETSATTQPAGARRSV